MGTASDLIRRKSGEVHTVTADCDVLEAVRRMNRHRVGSLIVTEGPNVVGMFTERDVLRLVAALRDLGHLHVGEVMTRDIITISPDTEIDDIQETMRSRKIRHLPVIGENGRLVGLVSMGDINCWCVHQQAQQLEGLTEYIHGRV
jgi:CBS domain-containing protein